MSAIVAPTIGKPIEMVITISMRANGQAEVQTRVEPVGTDVLLLSQVLVGIVNQYLLAMQQARSMLVGGKPAQKPEGENGG